MQSLSKEIRDGIEHHGIRNSHHNTIAPTGTISLLANNISNGLEPIFSSDYQRNVRTPDDKSTVFQVTDYALRLWRQSNPTQKLPPAWVDTHSLTPEQHLAIQSVIQPFVDNAISKTINIPADFPFASLSDIYSKAYELGLKGCTIFRPNAVTGSVLQNKDDDSDRCCQI